MTSVFTTPFVTPALRGLAKGLLRLFGWKVEPTHRMSPPFVFIGAPHTSNCCGQVEFVGIRASEQTRYQALEAQCVVTYPACGCPAQQPLTDDGSRLRFDDVAGVACVQGTCTTFVPDCGAPCGAGTTCFSCADRAGVFAACTTTCAGSAACTDATRPLCQMGATGNVAGMFCTPSEIACDAQ